MAKRKFRLLAGCHSEGTDQDGKPITFRKGDVFESDYNLDKMFNSVGAIKFEALDGVQFKSALEDMSDEELAAEVVRRQEAKAGNQPTSTEYQEEDSLDSMTVRELKNFAEQEEIDLGNASTKENIIRVIRSSQNA